LSRRKISPYSEGRAGSSGQQCILVENSSIVDGSYLRDASAYSVSKDGAGNYQIDFSLNPDGAQRFGEWTGKNINRYLAVVLNDEVRSAAYIKSQIFAKLKSMGALPNSRPRIWC
jgi:preprotein translocase subunit SecD